MVSTKKIKPPPDDAFSGKQLSLFQTFLYNTEEERDKLSNTIELWDLVPKYFISRQHMNKLRNDDGNLRSIEKDFVFRGKSFKAIIRPARITFEKGQEKEFYPSAREELVEDALRKIAAEQDQGFLDGNNSGVTFSLYMLRQELKKRNHSMSYQEVIESLSVMSNCRIEINTADGEGVSSFPILSGLIGVSQKQFKEDPQSRWIAYFNPLVTESMRAMTYRQYDYHTMMSHRTQLARYLHKRFSHVWTNAEIMNCMDIKFSTIQRDSGLLNYEEIRFAVRKLDESFDELKASNVISSYTKDIQRGARNKILDVMYHIWPSVTFVKEVKRASKRLNDLKKESVGLGHSSRIRSIPR